jgi:hypothetical protein
MKKLGEEGDKTEQGNAAVMLLTCGRYSIQISAGVPAILTKVFNSFPQSLQASSGEPQFRPQSLPSRSFPIYNSATILPFNTLQNKPKKGNLLGYNAV